MKKIGDINRIILTHNFTLKRRIVRIAYPRNGNVDNPTLYTVWDVYKDDKLIDAGITTMREARAIADGLK